MRRYCTIIALLALSACDGGGDVDGGVDAALTRDAGALDSGTDAGPIDAGPIDAGDSGASDSGPSDSGPADGGPADGGPADGGPACALPATAPFTSAGPFENVAITWSGAACGVSSDGADEDALLVFTNVEGLTGQSFDDWVIDSVTGGTLLGSNVLDEIPADTPVTLTLSKGGMTIELTFTLTTSVLTLSAFSIR